MDDEGMPNATPLKHGFALLDELQQRHPFQVLGNFPLLRRPLATLEHRKGQHSVSGRFDGHILDR
jgi:hypothetical protein